MIVNKRITHDHNKFTNSLSTETQFFLEREQHSPLFQRIRRC
jgi:hypothetical protein